MAGKSTSRQRRAISLNGHVKAKCSTSLILAIKMRADALPNVRNSLVRDDWEHLTTCISKTGRLFTLHHLHVDIEVVALRSQHNSCLKFNRELDCVPQKNSTAFLHSVLATQVRHAPRFDCDEDYNRIFSSCARIPNADNIDLQPWQALKCVPDLYAGSLLVSSNNGMLTDVEYLLHGRKGRVVYPDEWLFAASGNKLWTAG
jgi:hypothetical protein